MNDSMLSIFTVNEKNESYIKVNTIFLVTSTSEQSDHLKQSKLAQQHNNLPK